MKKNLPCQCHICKIKFAIELGKGGICANCNEPACNGHLSKHTVSGNTLYICAKCITKSTNM